MRLRDTIIGGLLGSSLSWLLLSKQFGTRGYQPSEYACIWVQHYFSADGGFHLISKHARKTAV